MSVGDKRRGPIYLPVEKKHVLWISRLASDFFTTSLYDTSRMILPTTDEDNDSYF